MQIVEIAIAEITVGQRIRPAHAVVVEQLARDITARNLRLPIEVARKSGKGWKLVSGLHRLSACKSLGWKTIPAIEIAGTATTLRRDEWLENLVRNELTVLERCQVTAALKQQFLEEHPEARRGVAGGRARQGTANAKITLADWYAKIAARSERAKRTIQLLAAIGERLDAEAADRLRGTEFEDNQFELEALARRTPEEQRTIAQMLAGADPATASVRAAIALMEGQPAEPTGDRALSSYIDRWRRFDPTRRRAFLRDLTDDEVAELAELIDERMREVAA